MIMPLIIHIVIYALAGIFAGLMSGILGIGGGIVVVPALLIIFKYNTLIPPDITMHMAAATSLAAMIATSISSIIAHSRHGEVLWQIYCQKLMLGIMVGVVCGALLASYMPTRWLEIFLGVFLILVATKMAFHLQVRDSYHFPPVWVNGIISWIIGLKSGLLGIGGGTLIIPYLTYCGVELRKTAAVSALCTLTVSILGTTMFIMTGWHRPNLPHFALGYVYWPAAIAVAIPSILCAPIGAKLTYRLPVHYLTYGFVVLLIVTAIHLLVT